MAASQSPDLIPTNPELGQSFGWLGALAVLAWLTVLAVILMIPPAVASPTLKDDLTRGTVRLSLLYYGVAASLRLLLHADDWFAQSTRGRLARLCWTLAWLAYLIHLGVAFHHYHHWSHADAVKHTRDVSGVGEGIYVSHLFTLVWTADVVWWWRRPRTYAVRSAWIGRMLNGFMVFVIFNATVVYEQGLIRWAGLALITGLAGLWGYRRLFFSSERIHSRHSGADS
jgi:hypothetical protein